MTTQTDLIPITAFDPLTIETPDGQYAHLAQGRMPEVFAHVLRDAGQPVPNVWGGAGYTVLASNEPGTRHTLLHVSLCHADRDLTWDEIKQIRALFFPPEIDAVMILPRESQYVNVHRFCFHLYQCPTEWELV